MEDGNVQFSESHLNRQSRFGQLLDAISRDVHFAWRLARRQPWMIVAAISSIAVGVGLNAAVTSVVAAVLLNPLGIQNADRIVAATIHFKKLQMQGSETSGAEFHDLTAMDDTFTSVAATEPRAWTAGGDQPSRLLGLAVTPEFLSVFHQKPALGRFFNGDNRDEVFLSDEIWKSMFAGRKEILGRNLLLDGAAYRIVGVAPAGFHFPASAQAWVPLNLFPDHVKRGFNMSLSLYANLRPGVNLVQAQRRLNTRTENLLKGPAKAEFGNVGYGIDLKSLSQHMAGDLTHPLWLLWLAALLLLLSTCANIAGLMLARSAVRRREMAIRISVGAGTFQIIRQLLTESTILALCGGVVGTLLASLCLDVIKRQRLPHQSLFLYAHIDYRLFCYAMLLALATSVIFGLAPAVQLLKSQHVSAMAKSRRKWFQNLYIVGQVAAAMLLLIITGLLLKSLQAAQSVRVGFDPQNLTTAYLIKPVPSTATFYNRLLQNLRTAPGVQSAALAYSLPFSGDSPLRLFAVKSRKRHPGVPDGRASGYQVSADYFQTMRIPLLRGRYISDSDLSATAPVCVIDSTLVNRFFSGQDPIGQEVGMYGGFARIVGVVAAVRDTGLDTEPRPAVYYPLAQIPYFPQIDIVVRTTVSASSLIRNAVRSANSAVPVFDIKSMNERIDSSISTRSATSLLVTLFAFISGVLAAIGIHGVIAQVVSQRTSEIGIRMALGAGARRVFRDFALQGLRLAALGVVLGLATALACQSWLQTFLYEVRPIDPETIFFGILCVLALTCAAVFGPSWRAARVDPQTALRAE